MQRVGRVGDRLALGRLADQDVAVLAERDDRRRGAIAFAVLDHFRLVAFHDRYAGVRGTQVDTNHFTHKTVSEICCKLSKLAVRWGRCAWFQALCRV